MSTSSRNKFLLLFSILFTGVLGLAQAKPVASFFFIVKSTYTAGEPSTSTIITVFDEDSAAVTTAETITLELLSGGSVISNAFSPSSITTTPGQAVYGGILNPQLYTLFRSGASIQIRARTGSVSNDSGTFSVGASSATKLIVLAPGETLAPGTNPSLTTGKSGSPSTQLVNQSFSVSVQLTDNQFNAVSGAPVVALSNSTNVSVTPASQALTAGLGSYSVAIDAPKISRTLTASSAGLVSGTADVTTAGPPAEEVFPFPSPFTPRLESINFQYRLDTSKDVKLKVLDQFGQQVWEKSETGQANTLNIIEWNGRTQMGDYTAAGVYYAVLEVGGSVKSKKKFGVKK